VSRCTRCLASIKPEEMPSYFASDFLCESCGGVDDSEFAQTIVAAERRKPMPEVNP
jgi:hypothetical protein